MQATFACTACQPLLQAINCKSRWMRATCITSTTLPLLSTKRKTYLDKCLPAGSKQSGNAVQQLQQEVPGTFWVHPARDTGHNPCQQAQQELPGLMLLRPCP